VKGLKERAGEFREFFANQLVPHFRAEEEVLFPQMRALVPESESIIEQLIRDHQQLRAAMPQLESGVGLGKLVFDLGDLLERHIRKEERELFPLFEQHVGETGAETIEDEIKKILDARPISP